MTWDCRRVWCAAKLRTCLLASPSLGIPCYRCQEVVGRLEDHCHWGSTDGVTFPFCDLKDKVETNFRSSFYAFTCFEFSFPCSGRTFVLKAQSQSGFFRFDIFLLPCNNTSSRRIPHSVHVWSLWYRLSWRLLYRSAGFWWLSHKTTFRLTSGVLLRGNSVIPYGRKTSICSQVRCQGCTSRCFMSQLRDMIFDAVLFHERCRSYRERETFVS